MRAILAIDQSTSATKALLFDRRGRVLARVSFEHRQFYPQPGLVEHDAQEILANVYRAIALLIERSSLQPGDIDWLSLTNQRETVVVWERHSGTPLTRALVWQDQRGTPYCQRLLARGVDRIIRARSGLIVDTYFSATKIQWIFEHVEGAAAAAQRGELLWGTIDTWLIWNLTKRRVHATDYSNACRSMLFDIDTCRWDDDLLELFGIPATMCPEALPSDADFGDAVLPGFPRAVPIRGVMGDSHAALFGQCCFSPGMAKATYGTGSSIMVNVGHAPGQPPSGIVRSIGWGCRGRVAYVLEGNIHAAGDTLRWLRDDLRLFEDYVEAERLAISVADTGGVYLVPAFNGLGAPHWQHDIPALLTGLARTTARPHIIRAALEAIAWQVFDVVEAMRRAPRLHIAELRVDGGPTGNRFLMQFQSDVLAIPVCTGAIEELSALGVVYMGGLALGVWRDTDEIGELWRQRTRYLPAGDAATRQVGLAGWKAAVRQALAWRR